MGLRRPLPQPSTPRRRPATLVALLQRAPTAQLARRPTPDQPRSQPPWAGHLVAGRLLDFASCAGDRVSVRDVWTVARRVAARVADAAAGFCLGGAGDRASQAGFS